MNCRTLQTQAQNSAITSNHLQELDAYTLHVSDLLSKYVQSPNLITLLTQESLQLTYRECFCPPNSLRFNGKFVRCDRRNTLING